jgi:hypothetical protein
MTAVLIIALFILAPVLLAILFRVHAVYVFLSIGAGSLLVSYLGDDADLVIGVVSKGPNTPMIANILALCLPLVFTMVFLRKSISKNSLALHVVPIILSGMLLGVLVLPLLDSNTQAQIFADAYGSKFKSAQDLIVGASALSTLSLMWATGKPRVGKHSKHHK